MEKILSIEECSFDNGSYHDKEGYKITTTNQEILMGIGSMGMCCENFGYLMSEDNLDDFIGSELIKIESVDVSLNVKVIEHLSNQSVDMDSCMFFNLYTTSGMLQFVAYNEHNGYYSHDVSFRSNQLTQETRI